MDKLLDSDDSDIECDTCPSPLPARSHATRPAPSDIQSPRSIKSVSSDQGSRRLARSTLAGIAVRYQCFDLPPTSSTAWLHYQQSGILRCKWCGIGHMVKKSEHAERHALMCKSKPVAGDSTPLLTQSQSQQLQSIAFCCANISYRAVEAMGTLMVRQMLQCAAMVSRRTAVKHVREFAESKLNGVLQAVIQQDPVVLAIDESTSFLDSLQDRPRAVAMACTSLQSGKTVTLHLALLERCNSQALVEVVQRVVDSGTLKADQIVAVIGDNASYMTSFVEKLKLHRRFHHVVQLRCVAHTISLQVETLMVAIPGLQPMLKSLASLRSRQSAEINEAMKSVLGSQITKGNDTRWAYYIEALDHLLERTGDMEQELAAFMRGEAAAPRLRWHDASKAIASLQTASDSRGTLRSTVSKLKDMKVLLGAKALMLLLPNVASFFKQVQAAGIPANGGSPARDVHALFVRLSKEQPKSMVKAAVTEAAEQLGWTPSSGGEKVYYCGPTYMLDSAAAIGVVDSFVVALERVRAGIKRNYTEDMRKLMKMKHALDPAVAMPGNADAAYNPSTYPLRSMVPKAEHSTLMHELSAYLSQDEFASARAGRQVPLQRHWELLKPSLPCLASYALKLSTVPMSSAAVERVFSVMSGIEGNKLRNRLGKRTFMAEMMIKANITHVRAYIRAQMHKPPPQQTMLSRFFMAPGVPPASANVGLQDSDVDLLSDSDMSDTDIDASSDNTSHASDSEDRRAIVRAGSKRRRAAASDA